MFVWNSFWIIFFMHRNTDLDFLPFFTLIVRIPRKQSFNIGSYFIPNVINLSFRGPLSRLSWLASSPSMASSSQSWLPENSTLRQNTHFTSKLGHFYLRNVHFTSKLGHFYLRNVQFASKLGHFYLRNVQFASKLGQFYLKMYTL